MLGCTTKKTTLKQGSENTERQYTLDAHLSHR